MMLKKCRAVVIAGFVGIAQGALAEGDVPFVPTSTGTVDAMLKVVEVGPDDFVIDLGSGDGRIVIAAARDYGARAMGVDVDEKLVAESRRNAERAGVSEKVEFRQQNLFETDLSKATVLTMYLLPGVNLKLRDKILSEMKPGSRVVSHDFDMGDWEPDAVVEVGSDTVYVWLVPAKVEGSWSINLPGPNGSQPVEINLDQTYQALSGETVANGKSTPLVQALLAGNIIALELANPATPGQTMRFLGKINGSKIEGVLEDQPAVMSRTAVSRAEP